MQYKDLLFKITSSEEIIDNNNRPINPIKQKLQSSDILIGVMIDEESSLSNELLNILKNEILRTLNILFNSPISETFAFLPYTKNDLNIIVAEFPEKRIHYIADEEEYMEIKKLKTEKLNITNVYKSDSKLKEFTTKIKYLVTVNIDIDEMLKNTLQQNDIMVFPIDLLELDSPKNQKEKLVKPDATGWVYNSASGMWVKTWGDDGMQELQGW
jgi:hypothetical protein